MLHFSEQASQAERDSYVGAIGGRVIGQIDALSTILVELPQDTNLETLPDSPLVEVMEPDYLVTALIDIPTSDLQYSSQWALPAIGVADYWQRLPADAPSVTVAIIDSGICVDHEDLVGRILSGYDFVENDTTPQDALDHGCGVAGVIAANINNGIGIAGIAANARILPLRVLDAQGLGRYSDVANAIIRATDEGAQILNLSLGGTNPSSILEDAIQYATTRGVLVVAAAGNTGDEVLYPAAYSSVIAVGSVDPDLQISSFSSRGPDVDVLAPGRDILVTTSDGGYMMKSGTSFAAPHVTGIAALELTLGETPNFEESLVEDRSGIEEDPGEVSAQAAFIVDSFGDEVDANPGDGVCAAASSRCTLRAAIMETNALPDADTITVPRGTYTLALTPANEDGAAGGDLDIVDSLTINGAGAAVTAIEASFSPYNADRAVDVDPLASGITVVINGITIRDMGMSGQGAALRNDGTLTLDRVIIKDNIATYDGGGIYNTGSLTITHSDIINNRTNNGSGGGIYNARNSQLTITNSLIRDNQALGTYGGQGAGIYNDGTLNVTNSTFTDNDSRGLGSAIVNLDYGHVTLNYATIANNSTAGNSGAIYTPNYNGSFTLSNTLLAQNWNVYVDPPVVSNCRGRYYSEGHNLIDAADCVFVADNLTDLIGVDPLLADLAYAGGFSESLALQVGSPAIDAADPSICVDTDQRDAPRPGGDTCDIGAYEFGASEALFPPRVLSVDTAGGPLEVDGDVYGYTTDFVRVTFDDDLLDPAGDSDDHDVTNPANYRLINPGTNDLIETITCGTLAGDDVTVPIQNTSYADRAATLTFADTLPAGSYRLLVCGSTSIKDLDSNSLDGNFDGIGGDDFLLNFGLSSVGETPQPGPDFVVNTTDDTDDALCSLEQCSLRDAIIATNAWAGPETPTISVPEGTYNLTLTGINEDESATGDLDITADVSIIGTSAVATLIDGQQQDRVFQIHNGVQVTLTDLTIQNGQTYTGLSSNSTFGAGIQILDGHVTLERVIVSDNSSLESGGGGGIHIAKAGGQLFINDSVIRNNTMVSAGGIMIDSDTQVTITNSAIIGNVATSGLGGGIIFTYRDRDTTRLEITNSTIANNVARQGGGIYRNGDNDLIINHTTITGNTSTDSGGGLYCYNAQTGSISIQNSILSGNNGSVGFMDVAGCLIDGTSNITTYTDPMLGPLADNGGLAPSMALQPGSPAIGRGQGECPPTDQRGMARSDGGCDLGAYEAVEAAPLVLGAILENTAPPQIVITFSEFMQDPPDDTASNDVTNLANYRLIDDGPDEVMQSTTCGTLQGDDILTPLNSAIYDNLLRQVTLLINDGTSLPSGRYQLVLCDSISDLENTPLLSEFADLLYVDSIQSGPRFVVNVTEDVNDGECGLWHCSLREAVIAANQYNLSFDTRVVVIPAGLYYFSIPGNDDTAEGGDLDILRDMVIVGAGADQTIVDGSQIDRIFHIDAGVSGRKVTIANLTMRNGRYQGNGGGILINGVGNDVQLDRVQIVDNEAGDSGGGIGFWGGTESRLTVRNSLISGNITTGRDPSVQGRGGGIFNWGVLTIENTTIHNNVTDGFGGGVLNFGIVTMNNATITDNTADNNLDGGTGGGIYNGSGTNVIGDFTLTNSIVAHNINATAPDCIGGTSITGGHNLIGDSTLCAFYLTDDSNVFDVDPALSPLADNGGSSLTQALLPGSPAIDSADAATCTVIDQRGVPRQACDIGAYEATSTPFDEIPPVVLDVQPLESVLDVSSLVLTFNEAMLDPAGDTGPDDVTNPANYHLIGAGEDRVVTTTSCAGLQGDDVSMSIDGATYDDAFYQATLSVNHAVSLPLGSYRLLACGSTTLRDTEGNTLDGNMDGSGGDDFSFDLLVEMPQSGPDFLVNIGEDVDDGICSLSHCSLREAVIAANDFGSGTTIELPAGTYNLNIVGNTENAAREGDLDLLVDLVIQGAGRDATVIDGRNLDRIFDVFANVEIGDLTVRGGLPEQYGDGGGIRVTSGHLYAHDLTVTGNSTDRASGGGISAADSDNGSVSLILERSLVSYNDAGDGSGGGVYVEDVTSAQIIDSTLSNNTAGSAVTGGGGVFSENFLLDNRVTISGSTITNNVGVGGGGIVNRGDGHMTVVNSTLTGNRAYYDGGGLETIFQATTTLHNVTITDNLAQYNNDVGQGGGIYADLDSTINLGNSLIYGNIDIGGEAPDCHARNSVLNSEGHNLIGDTTNCELTGDLTGDIYGEDPLLGPLQNNGGYTDTRAIDSSSPAVNAGDNSLCPAFDQRGVSRPQAGLCDIGAYEFDFSEILPPLVQRIVNGDDLVLANGVTVQTLSEIRITFSEAMRDVAGDSDPDDVTNPLNYRLLMTGADGLFDTASCGDDPADDVVVPIDHVTYNAAIFTASLFPQLPGGNEPEDYRLLACGSTTIMDSAGTPLDGNRDGTGGDDYQIDFVVVPVQSSSVFTVNVTEDADDGLCDVAHCTLREAINAANQITNATVQIPEGTYALTLSGSSDDSNLNGDLDILKPMTISGAGAGTTVIDGNQLDRVFDIHSSSQTVLLTGLAIQNGSGTPGGGIQAVGNVTVHNSIVRNNHSSHGGGIYLDTGALVIDHSVIADNVAGWDGGGIYIGSQGGGTLTIDYSSVVGNQALNNQSAATKGGGGISSRGVLTIQNSLIADNTADEDGGGILYAPRTDAPASLVVNSTISGNTSGHYGGGIYATYSTTTGTRPELYLHSVTLTDNTIGLRTNYVNVYVQNTILAANRPGQGASDWGNDYYPSVLSEGYNLIGDDNGRAIAGDLTGNIINVAPLLGPLQSNGGPTLTHDLQPESPAVDAGSLAVCEAIDQRGLARPQGLSCDIGAVEHEQDTLFAPLDFTATPHDPTSIQLTWVDNSANETGFAIERSRAGENDWQEIVRVSDDHYLDTGLTCDTYYDYRIRAYHDNTFSPYAEFLDGRTRGCPGSPPSFLQATVTPSDTVALTWEDNTLAETLFAIERSENTPDNWGEIATVDPGVIIFEDTTALPATTYFYRVRALENAVYTEYSETVDVTTPGARQAGPTFTVVTADPAGGLICRVDDCSLRAAILAANAHESTDTIAFNLPAPHLIQPVEALPVITDPLVIDGTTQPGYAGTPVVELNGQNALDRTDGLAIHAGGSTIRGLVINNFYYGIVIEENGGNVIAGNFIGTDAGGMSARPNDTGVYVKSGSDNLIGGVTSQDRNLISGNTLNVRLDTANNGVQGNFIGTNLSGTAGLGSISGLHLMASSTIGGAEPGAGNLISGHQHWGIYIEHGVDYVIQGNHIGTAGDGTTALSNGYDGIYADTGTFGTIGGPDPDARNIISANGQWGLNVVAADMQNNFIGVDETGMQPLGNGSGGIRYWRNEQSASIVDNVISANGGPGIYYSVGEALIQGNMIGTDKTGSAALGNHGAGIEGHGGSTIGGSPETANIIAYNDGDGIWLVSGRQQRIQANPIFANGGMGIDILGDGVNSNDLNDSDSGANDQQNYPELSFASTVDGVVTVQGTLNSSRNLNFDIDFYANATCDESGHGEGEIYLGRVSTRIDESYLTAFSALLEAELPAGYVISATATDQFGSTSEFSACIEAVGEPQPPVQSAVAGVDERLISLSWSPAEEHIANTHLERLDAAGGSWEEIAQMSPDAVTYEDEAPECFVELQYRLRNFRAEDDQYSDYSTPVDALSGCEPLLAAADSQVAVLGPHQVELSWTDTNASETGYEVEYSINGVSRWVSLGIASANTESLIHVNLHCESSYYYRIKALRTFDRQVILSTGILQVRTPACGPLNPPASVVGNALSRNTAELSWVDSNPEEAILFNVQRSQDSGISWTEIAQLPRSATRYIDSNLQCEQSYEYRVRAYRPEDNSFSEYSVSAPVTTDSCPVAVMTTVGLYRQGVWQFWNTHHNGAPDIVFQFGPSEEGWLPVTGDWDGDGIDGIGLYKNGLWILREMTDAGLAERMVSFGAKEPGWRPIAGDWNGDDVDGTGLYKDGYFYLKQTASSGSPDLLFAYGPTEVGWLPVAGDWNSSGNDSVGVFKDGLWLLSNSLPALWDVSPFNFGPAEAGWMPVTGDWDESGLDTAGIYRNGLWQLHNENMAGAPEISYATQISGNWLPVANYRGGLTGLQALSMPVNSPAATPTQTVVVSPTVTPDETIEVTPETTADSPTSEPVVPTEVQPTPTEEIITEPPIPTETLMPTSVPATPTPTSIATQPLATPTQTAVVSSTEMPPPTVIFATPTPLPPTSTQSQAPTPLPELTEET